MTKFIKILFIGIFFAFCSVIGIMTLDNHIAKSETEARKLNQFPALKLSSLIDADYLSKFNDAFSDQLQYREKFIKAYYVGTTNILQLKYQGETVVGKENYLFHEPEVIYDKTAYFKEIRKIADLVNKEAETAAKNGRKFIYINYPRKDVAMSGYLPDWYISQTDLYNEAISVLKENLSENVIFIDANELFQQNGGKYYYKTDHHVNAEGQELIYKAVCDIMRQDFPNMVQKDLNSYAITQKTVKGSFDRKLGYSVTGEPENLCIKPNGWSVKYTRNNKAKIWGTGDTYASAFMGGDYAYTIVKTKNKNNPSVVISGSSFTNGLESMLVPSAKTMVSVDFRHNKNGHCLEDYAGPIKAKYIIYIPNSSNYMFNYEIFKMHMGQ